MDGVEGSGGYGLANATVALGSCTCKAHSTVYVYIKGEENLPCKSTSARASHDDSISLMQMLPPNSCKYAMKRSSHVRSNIRCTDFRIRVCPMGVIAVDIEPLGTNSTVQKESSSMPPHQEKVDRGKLMVDANSSWVSFWVSC